MMKATLTAIVLAVIVQLAQCQTITFYIDAANGVDATSRDGSTSKPWKTFAFGIQTSTSIINSGTYSLVTYSLAAGNYPVTLPTTLTFSSSSPIAVTTTGTAGSATISGSGTGFMKFSGGFSNYTFTGIKFSNIIADSSSIQSAGSVQFTTPADVFFRNCVLNGVAGLSAVGNIDAATVTIDGTGTPGNAVAFQNSDARYGVKINVGTINNLQGTVTTSYGQVSITSVNFNTVSAIFSTKVAVDNAKITLNRVNAINVQNAIAISSTKAVSVSITNSQFNIGEVIASINIVNTATLTVSGTSVSHYDHGAFLLQGIKGKLVVANFTSCNFTNNYSVEIPVITAFNTSLGVKNCVFTNNTGTIPPISNSEGNLISLFSSPVYLSDSVASFISVSFSDNKASLLDQQQGTYGGAVTCSSSTASFNNVTFSDNGQSDLLCDLPCNSTGVITNICELCVRELNGVCKVPITSSALTTAKLPDFTTGSRTTAAYTSGKELTTGAFRETTGTTESNINNAAFKAVSVLLMAVLLMASI